MNLLLAVSLTLGLQRPVYVLGCCPVSNVLVMRVVPVLVLERPVPVPVQPAALGAHPMPP